MTPRLFQLLPLLAASFLCCTPSQGQERISSGLQVFYDFRGTEGTIVKNKTSLGKAADLRIGNPKPVKVRDGSLVITGKTQLRTDEPPQKLIDAIRKSGAITAEAWITPANTSQAGPARILTLSKDSNERNFTLGQDGKKFEFRFRTTKTGKNGTPSLSSQGGTAKTGLTHVVGTRSRAGKSTIYINGKKVADKKVDGSTVNWDGSFRLALADELNFSRPWMGTFHLVAIYSRDLNSAEVAKNFKAGPGADSSPSLTKAKIDPQVELFENQIAPLLSNHCLECHDTSTNKGKLDLSRHGKSFADDGILIPKNHVDSLLWESIESDEMPKDRPSLTAAEKTLVKKWIAGGAKWSLAQIDPALYVHGNQANENWIQRLTTPEYIATVNSTTGVDISAQANKRIPIDLRADGFSNTAYNLGVDLKHISAYSDLAGAIVEEIDVPAFAKRFSSKRLLTDDVMRALIEKMGQWMLRGPLEAHEVDTYRGLTTTVASAGGDFDDAVALVIEAMLQSPRFLYRIEVQQGDGTDWPTAPFALASRLSYILWGDRPDKELMNAAENGSLSDRDELAKQVKRMMNDPRVRKQSFQFAEDWMNLGRLQNLLPDPGKFPDWDDQLASDMKQETLSFFEEVVWNENRPLSDLLNAQVTFLTPALAKHYGLPPKGEAIAKHDLSKNPDRGGLLTQGSILTIGGDEASMVTRGLFVMNDLLRGVVKAPPPCVDTTPVPSEPGLTQRSIALERIGNKNCGGCHSKFEPLAFGLEKFDGIGAFHAKDRHGNELRNDGEILFPGTAESVKYQNSAELMNLLSKSDRVRESITWKLTQFALGRPLSAGDAGAVEKIHTGAIKGGGTYVDVITAIALSDLVRKTKTSKPNQ